MIVTSICAVGTYLISLTLHLFVSTIFLSRHCHSISFFDMSYNSSHLRTNSINFKSISDEKPGSSRRKQTLEVYWTRRWTVHIIRIELVQASSDPFRPVKQSRSATVTERN